MSHTGASDRGKQIEDEFKQMLESLSKRPPGEHYCERCGTPLTQMSACFWLNGSDQSWTIPLACCPTCDTKKDYRQGCAA